MIVETLLLMSIVVQVAAAAWAIRLIAITGRHIAWILIAGALTLMAVRRFIPLVRMISGDSAIRPDPNAEAVALVISLLFLIGILKISSILKESNRAKNVQIQAAQEWQSTFDASEDAIWIVDLHDRIVRSNQKAETLFSLSAAEMIGRPYRDVLERILPDVSSEPVFPREQGAGREAIERQANDAWYSITRDAIRNGAGRKTATVHVISDITARKQTLETLRASEARLRSVLDNMMEGCQILDRQWRYLYLNRPAEIHARRSKEELLGHPYPQLWPGHQNTAVFDLMKRVMAERVSEHLENEFIFPDGQHGWFNLSIQPAPEGILILSIDITQPKLAEEALLNERNLYKDLVASQPAGVYRLRNVAPKTCSEDDWVEDVERHYRLEMISDRFCEILGLTHEQCRNNASVVVERIHPDDRADFVRQNVCAVQEFQRFEWEGRLISEARARWVYFTSIPRHFPNGDIVWTGILLDITERKRAEEQLKQLNDQLEEKINERTAELQEAVSRLAELNRVFVGRELKMAELKDRIAELENSLPQDKETQG